MYDVKITDDLEISKIIDISIKIYSIKFCNKCGLLYRDTRFTNEELALMYQKQYSSVNYEKYINRSVEIEGYLENNLQKKIEKMTILDVGGGKGEITHYFSKSNKCIVLEFDIPDYNINKNLKITSDVFSINDDIDIIFINQVAEHLNKPFEFIKNVLDNINNEVFVYIEVPFEISHYLLLKTKGHYEHINYFSEQSLYNLSRLLGGKDIKVETRNAFGDSMLSVSSLFKYNPNQESPQKEIHALYKNLKNEAYSLKNISIILRNKIVNLGKRFLNDIC
jgi:hypothetical protein